MKYKVGDNVCVTGTITEIEAGIDYPYKVEFDQGSFDWVKMVKPCSLITYEDGLKDGRKQALREVVDCQEAKYNQGLNAAWELARKITQKNQSDREEIFNFGYSTEIFQRLTPRQALAKIEAYEKSQHIEIGDEVEYKANKRKFIVLNLETGKSISTDLDRIERLELKKWTKTGRHFDIEHLLEQIRGNE